MEVMYAIIAAAIILKVIVATVRVFTLRTKATTIRTLRPVKIIPPEVPCKPAEQALPVRGEIVNIRWGLTT
jgi:hypothetical protein